MKDLVTNVILIFTLFVLGINTVYAKIPEANIPYETQYKESRDKSKAVIAGTIIDKNIKDPLTGATVQIDGKQIGTVTDFDGVFELELPSEGKYNLTIKYIGYKTINLTAVEAIKGKKTVLNIEMADESLSLEGVVVMAQMKLNSDISLLTTVKNNLLVQSGISAQQISKTQDSDASAVIKRIPGISLIDNKFVMVRGLSQRYNNVWINNSGVPSSEADSRAFSFDIIPSSQLDNMMVVKSPAPELPSDFSGGFIKINTKDVPEKRSLQISLGGAVNDKTHFHDAYKNYGSATDFLGFDNGFRSQKVDFSDTRLNNKDADEVTSFTKNGLNNDWRIKQFKPVADMKLGVAYNDFKNFDNGQRFAILAALNYSSGSKTYSDMSNSRFG